MEISIKNIKPVKYSFIYNKKSLYKKKILFETNDKGKLNFKLDNESENLELIFRNESFISSISKDPLIFTPVKYIYDKELNIYIVKNKKNIKLQWSKFKEKYRNKMNSAILQVLERLYFHVPLGLEYEFLSNGCYMPYFLNIYDKLINEDAIFNGMSWVHSPLGLPLKIDYQLLIQEKNTISFKGTVSLDDEKFNLLLVDKSFQKKAKSYHYTKDFTIESDIYIKYSIETGYIISSSFLLKIFSEREEINEIIEFKILEI